MTLRVRAMQNTDLDRVYAIEAVAHRAPWGRDILSDCVFVGYDCRVVEVENDKGAELAGYVISRYDDTICHVLNLCMAPAFQGKGFGRYLLQNVIDAPAKPEAKIVILEVRPSNIIALSLYQKMGFQQLGIKQGYYNDEQGIEDGLVLQKIIER